MFADLLGKNDNSVTEEERLDQKLEKVLKEEEDKRQKEVEKGDSKKEDSKKEDSEKEGSEKDQKTPDPKKESKAEPVRQLAGALEDLTPEARKATFEHLLLNNKQVRAELTAILSAIIKAHPTKYYKFVVKGTEVSLIDQNQAAKIITANAIDASKAKSAAETCGKEVAEMFDIYLFEERADGIITVSRKTD